MARDISSELSRRSRRPERDRRPRSLRRFARTVEPGQIRLFAEPDQLAARVAAVLLRDERSRRAPRRARRAGARAPAGRHRPPNGRAVSGMPAREQRRHLVEQARARTARRRGGSRARRSRPPAAPSAIAQHVDVGDRRRGVGEVLRQRPAGQEEHLQRADHPLHDRAAECGAPTPRSTRRSMRCRRPTPRRAAIASRRSRQRRVAAGPGNRPRVSAR